MQNKVSHVCLIDEKDNVYLEDNKRLKGLSFLGGKLEDLENFEDGGIRELSQETKEFLILAKGILKEIEKNSEIVDGILWKGKLYGLKITEEIGNLLIKHQSNIVKVNINDIKSANISEKLNKKDLIKRIKLTIKKLING